MVAPGVHGRFHVAGVEPRSSTPINRGNPLPRFLDETVPIDVQSQEAVDSTRSHKSIDSIASDAGSVDSLVPRDSEESVSETQHYTTSGQDSGLGDENTLISPCISAASTPLRRSQEVLYPVRQPVKPRRNYLSLFCCTPCYFYEIGDAGVVEAPMSPFEATAPAAATVAKPKPAFNYDVSAIANGHARAKRTSGRESRSKVGGRKGRTKVTVV